MPYWLASYCIYDHGHEHNGHLIVQARSEEEAQEAAEDQEHGQEGKAGGWWDYDDYLTSSELIELAPINQAETKLLERLGVAFRLPRKRRKSNGS